MAISRAKTGVKRTLLSRNVRPRKRLGQNFLVDSNVVAKVVRSAGLGAGDTVLEVGPGTGCLTQALAENAATVVAVEFDKKMVAILSDTFKNAPNVRIVSADILAFDETALARPYKVVANLPFYLTAPVIRKFLESKTPPTAMTLIVQKEVAQRICAKPPRMSILALSVQFYAAAAVIGYVSRGCFWPIPNVDSAIIRITPGPRRDADLAAAFFKVVRAGFSHPRKQLINNFSAAFPKCGRSVLESWLHGAGVAPAQRAETVGLEQWINLANVHLTNTANNL